MDEADIKSCLRILKPDNKFYSNVNILSEYLTKDINTDEISVRYIMNKLSEDNILRLANLKKVFYPDYKDLSEVATTLLRLFCGHLHN